MTYWDATASLLLAQLVFQYGDTDFTLIHTHLKQHPLLRRPVPPVDELETHFEALLQQHQLQRTVPAVTQLCQKLHQNRVAELKTQIRQEEEAFKRITEEIKAIQSGQWKECTRNLTNVTDEADAAPATDATNMIDVTDATAATCAIDAVDTQDINPNNTTDVDGAESTDNEVGEDHGTNGTNGTSMTGTMSPLPVVNRESSPHVSLSVKIERKGRSEVNQSPDEVQTEATPRQCSFVAEKELKTLSSEKKEVPFDSPKSTKKPLLKKGTRGFMKKEEATESLTQEHSGDHTQKAISPEMIALKRFQSMIMPLWMSLSQHKHGTVFMGPVSNKDAPGYSSLIYFPTDMKSIRNKIRDGTITTSKQFQREILLLFANAIMYNGEDSMITQWAKEGFEYSEEMIHMFMETESIVGNTGTKGVEEVPKLKRKKVL